MTMPDPSDVCFVDGEALKQKVARQRETLMQAQRNQQFVQAQLDSAITMLQRRGECGDA